MIGYELHALKDNKGERLTFIAMIVVQPLTSERPLIQPVLKPFNDERLSSHDNMQYHEFFECFQTLKLNHVTGDPDNIFKVRSFFNK